jgi:sugar phosphate isomerase/epimerase
VLTSFNGNSHWHFAHPKPEVRRATTKHVKESVDLAVDLNASVVEVVSGVPKLEGASQGRAWKWMVEQVGECADYAEQRNVIIGLNPSQGTSCLQPDLRGGWLMKSGQGVWGS